ncbi:MULTISPECIES: MBL fold metallo-hydrolase [Parachlamydia]|uniref:MBL fold metallo-hydrolase n=1 Tax=Parachlamydia TaxID=83551 RepID=UPI0024E22E00|nr:MBL fold metallo-hydrolase [Parachlamydia acanthamoebae]
MGNIKMQLRILEGNRLSLDGGAMFGNAPKELWKRWIAADELNRIPLASRTLLIQVQDQNILLEAGSGAFFDPKLRERYGINNENVLIENLQKIGLSHQHIDAVVLSHLHFDHAGGLLSAYKANSPLQLLFPNAQYFVGKEHWEYAQKPHIRETASFIPQLHTLLQESGRLVLIEGTSHPSLNFGISFVYSHGHTRGLMLAKLRVNHHTILFASDLIPGIPWLHLPITMGYDRFSELMVDEKRQILSQLEKENGVLIFCHDPSMSCGKLGRNHSERYSVTAILEKDGILQLN